MPTLEITKRPRAHIIKDMDTCGFSEELILALHQNGGKFVNLANNLTGGMDGSFLQIINANRIALSDLQVLWLEYNTNKGKLRMANRLPDILEGVSREASGNEKVCSDCKGLGRIMDAEETFPTCDLCEGTGRVFRAGDRSAQRLTLETLGLIGTKPVVNIGNTTNFSLTSLTHDISDMLKNPDVIDIGSSAT